MSETEPVKISTISGGAKEEPADKNIGQEPKGANKSPKTRRSKPDANTDS